MKDIYYDVDLSKIYNEFDNKTMRYRINSFAYACGIKDIDIIPNSKALSKNEENGKQKYHIVAEKYYEEYDEFYDIGYKIINLYGKYDNLHFCFTNLIHSTDNLNNQIKNLPFSLNLVKEYDGHIYSFVANPIIGILCNYKFIFTKKNIDNKCNDEISFKVFLKDFDKVLPLIKSFIDNPKIVFDYYNDGINYSDKLFFNSTVNQIIKKK